MMTFILSLNWTDQGVRGVKDAPKRAQASRDLAKKVGVEIKQIYLTSGDADLVFIIDAPNGDNPLREIRAGVGHARQFAHPHRSRVAGGGILEARLRTALNGAAAAACPRSPTRCRPRAQYGAPITFC